MELTRRRGIAALIAGASSLRASNNASAQSCPESVCVYPQYPNDIVRPNAENIYWDPQFTFQEEDGTKVLHPVYLARVKLYANKVYDLRNVQVQPNGSILNYDYTIMNSDSRLLPSPQSPELPLSRIGRPELGINSTRSRIKFEVPQGSWITLVERWDKVGMEAPTSATEWLWLPEGAKMTNMATGVSHTFEGSFALPIGYTKKEQAETLLQEHNLPALSTPNKVLDTGLKLC